MQFHFPVTFANMSPTLATRYRSRPLGNASDVPSDHFWADPGINTVKHEEFSKKAKNQTTSVMWPKVKNSFCFKLARGGFNFDES